MSRSIQTMAARITFPCVVFILMSYTLHSFVFRVYGRLLETNVWFLVIAILLWSCSLVTYTRLWLTPPGSPSMLTKTRMDDVEITPRISLCDINGEIRVCTKCNVAKPDRTHHCRHCNQCILKMDHHCPWIGGCVGKNNQKLFYLFLVYTTTYACWMTSVILKPLTHAIFKGQPINLRLCWDVYKLYLYTLFRIVVNIYHIGRHLSWIPLLTDVIGWDEYRYIDIHWVVMLLLGILFTAVLSGFTGFHTYCILRNKTTIEHVSSRPYYIRFNYPDDENDPQQNSFIVITVESSERPWDNGIRNNWNSVMGVSPLIWFAPVVKEEYIKTNNKLSSSFSDTIYNRIVMEGDKQK
ncbi:DHHC palmitoyltransferase-domain-containing protein [Circinella umbellata]|nr:DHHC palmitoyltransferase-domain-containing protein [Circinella umbellata]